MNKRKKYLSLFIVFCLGVFLGKFAFQKDSVPAQSTIMKGQSKKVATHNTCNENSDLKTSLQSCLEELKCRQFFLEDLFGAFWPKRESRKNFDG